MKKTLLTVISLIICLSCIVSCSGTAEYKTDVAVSTLAERGVTKITFSSNLTEASSEFMSFFLNVDSSLYTECKVMTPGGSTSIDEFGIFKAKDADSAAKIADALNAYLKDRVATWDTRYSQTEKPKVDGAKTTVFGTYVCYTILSADEQTSFLNEIQDLLTK
ncbi:MAG: DUF4358 domain-containing protein [Clostridia bacterium]|nr:DUF4358 domain-containing protein [Clostridia bacterium]